MPGWARSTTSQAAAQKWVGFDVREAQLTPTLYVSPTLLHHQSRALANRSCWPDDHIHVVPCSKTWAAWHGSRSGAHRLCLSPAFVHVMTCCSCGTAATAGDRTNATSSGTVLIASSTDVWCRVFLSAGIQTVCDHTHASGSKLALVLP
jgi:hypothetical protein